MPRGQGHGEVHTVMEALEEGCSGHVGLDPSLSQVLPKPSEWGLETHCPTQVARMAVQHGPGECCAGGSPPRD